MKFCRPVLYIEFKFLVSETVGMDIVYITAEREQKTGRSLIIIDQELRENLSNCFGVGPEKRNFYTRISS